MAAFKNNLWTDIKNKIAAKLVKIIVCTEIREIYNYQEHFMQNIYNNLLTSNLENKINDWTELVIWIEVKCAMSSEWIWKLCNTSSWESWNPKCWK